MKLQKPLALRSFRLPSPDVEIWQAAAARLDISQSEFLRRALRSKAHEVLEQNDEAAREDQGATVTCLKKSPAGRTAGLGERSDASATSIKEL